MKRLFHALKHMTRKGEKTVLVTLIASSGSVPRGAGARMLVGSQGRVAGTVGGGAVESRCIETAQQILKLNPTQAPERRTFSLNQTGPGQLDMVCGGQVEAHFLMIQGHDTKIVALCERVEAAFEAGKPLWLCTPLERGELTVQDSATLAAFPRIMEWEGVKWFTEQIHRPGLVYIFGGGHVTQALVPVLYPLDFPCVVLENRKEFAVRELFPLAYMVKQIDFLNIFQEISITEHDYVCIMTRGHDHDLLVQQQVLRTPARYIGVIGSKRKAQYSFEMLQKCGFSQQELSRIVTPIGLPIGGRTPEEIAISIAAQLIQFRSKQNT